MKLLSVLGCFWFLLHTGLEASTVIYQTSFESAEGYDARFPLAGQRGWQIEGSGGNGLVEEFIPGAGQQAYIGFIPPTNTNDITSVWTPLNFTPPPSGMSILKFSVRLQFFESLTGGHDEFRWSVFNRQTVRLFSLHFSMKYARVYYALQDQQLHDTGWNFAFAQEAGDGIYDLEIWMDFARNSWTALLNGVVIANALPLRLGNSSLDLGDIDAVWRLDDPNAPGDNFMVFDDYRLTGESVFAIPSSLEALGVNGEGNFLFRAYAQPGVTYSIDVTSDFQDWFSLHTFQNTEGTFDFLDDTAADYRYGFYRLREIR